MRKTLLIAAFGLCLGAPWAWGDVVTLPEGERAPEIKLPAKGITMQAVENQYGEPREKYPAVGGGAPQQPPITRWDYDSFSVFFENDKVVDAVVPNAPPTIYHKEKLRPSATTPQEKPKARKAPKKKEAPKAAEPKAEEPKVETPKAEEPKPAQ